MARNPVVLSLGCYLAACCLPAVLVSDRGESVLSLTGWECLAFLPRILEDLPGTLLLLLAWLANPMYLRSLYQAALGRPQCHRSARIAFGLALSFLLYALFSLICTSMHILPGPGCLLWYGSMALMLPERRHATPD